MESGLQKGADFVEVFVEDSHVSSMGLLDQKIDGISSLNSFGVGIRLLFGSEVCYGYSSDTDEDVLLKLTENIAQSKQQPQSIRATSFSPSSLQNPHQVIVDPASIPRSERADLLRDLDKFSRKQVDLIQQVNAGVTEKRRSVLIANSEGLYVEDSRQYSRLRLSVVAEKEGGPQTASENPGRLGGYEVFQEMDFQQLAESTAASAIRMAEAGYISGKMMPVVLGNGFGGVIFHEACGHPLETEAIRKKASPFCGKLGERVAQPVLTAIDDGTLVQHWGSCNVDDEGQAAQRTVLIKDGVLENYLSDRIGAKQVGVPATSSARRESYKFAPVSRMRNTYIDKGPDSVSDIITSVDYGLYAKKMGGGSVNPGTGEFNFSVQEGYIIRKGKVEEAVRGATLIGKGDEALHRISMIADDLELAAGMCGAASGWVPTTVGQPTLKIDSILVGGR